MADMVDVAIDAGQTRMRIGLAYAGRVTRVADCPGLTYRHDVRPSDAVLAAITGPWAELAVRDQVATVCLGLTSVLGSADEYAALAGGLIDRLEAGRVLIAGDVVTAHAGAFGLGPGVVLAAGTGAIALGLDRDGVRRQVDGWGYLCGDAGGGFWIGRRGLEAALRGHDGRAEPSALIDHATAHFGELADLAETLYPAPDAVARIAEFAPAVLGLADADAYAANIVDEAARELAATVAAASGPGDLPVSWTGRLLQHDGLRRRFADELAIRRPGVRLHEPIGDGLDGAAKLAAAPELGLHSGLMRVTVR
ncbi:MAG: ATPase [Hamadaea sp.]|uniref:N-acetylglucosamine kinase n=1 Tax=Hamadaea sp. TaxID=2024425 RepID=UPI0017F8B0A9|nr:BadF/BadG/BcrA/BcrD ATPase family protein [Hamadaea sp.]NUT20942.1 ATPase [Hamadaea sp.]